jgi:hypothetical protein
LEQTEHYAKNTQKTIEDGMRAYEQSFQSNSRVISLTSFAKKEVQKAGGAG